MAHADMIYRLDDKPPPLKALMLALQHALTMFGSTVAVPLLLGPAMGMNTSEIALLISSVMLCSGLATLVQATFGTRLPIIQGVSFSFLAVFFAVIGSGAAGIESQPGPWSHATIMQYIAGTILVGALVEITVGFSGLFGAVRKFLSPVVIGPVIMLIGLALFQHGAPKAGTHWPIGGLTIFLIILFAMFLSRRSRIFKMLPMLLAIVTACAVCWVLSATGVFPKGHPSHVDLGYVNESPWFRLDPRELVMPWGAPRFHLGFIIAGLAAYLASMIESFGDYHACANMAGERDPTPKQISRGIGCEGIGCLITSLFGGFSSTSYSENIGLIGLTKVGSRYVVQIAAVLLVLLGLFSKFGAFAATVPGPVVGGLYCAMFGLIAAVGVQQLAKADLSSDRNLFVAGFSLFMGLSVQAYFEGLGPYDPKWASLAADLPEGIRSVIESIGKTGMGVAAIIGIILDNLIPGTDEERGISMLPHEGAHATEGVD